MLTTKLTAQGGTIFRGLMANATQLFACEATGSTYDVDIYSLPLTAAATPAVIMNSSTNSANDCALDASGNLYTASTGQVRQR